MDCDMALTVCKESRRALYRKALCLKELGKYKEAYNCTTSCMLDTRLVMTRHTRVPRNRSNINQQQFRNDLHLSSTHRLSFVLFS